MAHSLEPSSETQPLAEAEKLAMARRIADKVVPPSKDPRVLWVTGNDCAYRAALAAIVFLDGLKGTPNDR